MNQLTISGRMTADPEIASTTSGTTIACFSLAVDLKYAKEGQQKTDFFQCVAFGKLAEIVEKYLFKGSKIIANGEMRLDTVQKDGKNVTYPKVNVNEIEFCEKKSESNKTDSKNDFTNIPEGVIDELPFN